MYKGIKHGCLKIYSPQINLLLFCLDKQSNIIINNDLYSWLGDGI